MNKSKIEWCDWTWNPVTGCLKGCDYCYARRIYERFGRSFEPAFHEDRLDQPQRVKKPSKIFVCSVADLFGEWVPDEWIDRVISAAWKAPWHTYIWLTKNPRTLHECWWREWDWVGATVTRQEELDAALVGLSKIAPVNGKPIGKRFISFEPLLGNIELPAEAAEILDWIIVGAQTGPGAQPINIEWLSDIQRWGAGHSIPVFIKNSCGWWSRYQEFP